LIMLNNVKEYINIYKEKPSSSNDDINIKKLSSWISHQLENYKNNNHNMKDIEIKNLWEEFINNDLYKTYFLSNEEHWKRILSEIKKYINDNKVKPMSSNKNKTIKFYAIWLRTQRKNYLKKEQIMSDVQIYNLWYEFINNSDYSQYL